MHDSGVAYIYRAGRRSVAVPASLEQSRLMAETHAASGGDDIMIRWFRADPTSATRERFGIAWIVESGKISPRLDVTIPAAFM